jgi:hypothetical protein
VSGQWKPGDVVLVGGSVAIRVDYGNDSAFVDSLGCHWRNEDETSRPLVVPGLVADMAPTPSTTRRPTGCPPRSSRATCPSATRRAAAGTPRVRHGVPHDGARGRRGSRHRRHLLRPHQGVHRGSRRSRSRRQGRDPRRRLRAHRPHGRRPPRTPRRLRAAVQQRRRVRGVRVLGRRQRHPAQGPLRPAHPRRDHRPQVDQREAGSRSARAVRHQLRIRRQRRALPGRRRRARSSGPKPSPSCSSARTPRIG